MNSLISTPPPAFPHQLFDGSSSRHSPARTSTFPFLSQSTAMSTATTSRKRKADDDGDDPSNFLDPQDYDDRMSASPSASPSLHTRTLTHSHKKRLRSGISPSSSSSIPSGRPLTLPRLLETLDADSLRSVLSTLCTRHPQIGPEIVSCAPRPSVSSALAVIDGYFTTFRSAFPIGATTSDYAYHRVKQPLHSLLTALSDFTPSFLPPHEPESATSLSYLDSATTYIHRLPDWDNPANQHHKQLAYEEMSKAWALTIKEAAKRAGGIRLHNGGWEEKLAKHNQLAQGRMQGAVQELANQLNWMAGGGAQGPSTAEMTPGDHRSIRQELLSGRYGAGPAVSVGRW